ncbi:MAG: hypothetical protein ABI615_02500 [Chthoniobacterales bacterium]
MDRPEFSQPTFVHGIGKSIQAQVEFTSDSRRLDHVWIRMDTGVGFPIRISVNTLSKWNRDAGFDSRVRVGIVSDVWETPPPLTFEKWEHFDYAEIEGTANVFYEYYERDALEKFLLGRCLRARFLEVWGMTYGPRKPGIHQIHCRGASCAIPTSIKGQDGALQFYYPDQKWELVLFKFCGQ